MAVCLSHGGRNLSSSDGPDNQLLVGTLDCVVTLVRSGPQGAWQVTRRSLEGKHISALMIEPSRGRLLAGTHGDGVYASDDGGRTWERKDTGLKSGNVYSLNYVQAAGQTRLYAGTEPAHLHVSRDLGESWDELPALRSVPSVDKWSFPGEPHIAHVKSINFDPRTAETIYAAVEVGGLFKSSDSGVSWQELSGFYEDVHRVSLSPLQPDHVYISTGDGLYHSRDAGETWERLTDSSARIAYPDALILHPEREGIAFVAGSISSPNVWRTSHNADARIGRSGDGGATWEMVDRGLPEQIRGNIEAMSMNVWSGGFTLFAGTTDGDVFFSEDEGKSWSTIVGGLAPVSKAGHYRNLRSPDASELTAVR